MISDEARAQLGRYAEEFASARPFKHVVIDNFFRPEVAEAMLAQFPAATDRSKLLNEFGAPHPKSAISDVAGIGGVYKDVDAYIQQRDFIAAMETVTGIPDLRYDPHYYGAGTHENFHSAGLDAHYDFNIHPVTRQHRRINAIVYLNKDWRPEWRGSICFHSDAWDMERDEISEVQPIFNRCVVFETTEKSWHSVPPVDLPPELRDSVSRKSFTIYMYTQTRPPQEMAPSHGTVYVQRPLPSWFAPGRTLSEADVDEVKKNLQWRHNYLREMYKREYKFAALIDDQQAHIAELRTRLRAPVTGWAMVTGVKEPSYDDGWMGPRLEATVKTVRDVKKVTLFGWRPENWGGVPVEMKVGGRSKTIDQSSGVFEIQIDVNLPRDTTTDLVVTANARPAGGDDKRDLSIIINRIEFS